MSFFVGCVLYLSLSFFGISFFDIYFLAHPRLYLLFDMSWEPCQLQYEGFIKQMQLLQVVFWVRLASMAYELSLTAMEPRDKDGAVDVEMSFSRLAQL